MLRRRSKMPARPFQIDCNFGYAAGVNEMLVQSHMHKAGTPSTPDMRLIYAAEGRGGTHSALASKASVC